VRRARDEEAGAQASALWDGSTLHAAPDPAVVALPG
jgi:hypothetical protein